MVQMQKALVTRHGRKGSARTKQFEALLTADEAAERLHVSRDLVYWLIRGGALKAVRIGRLVRIQPEVLRDYMKSMDRRPPKGRPRS
jgi:excisionase family DNA binding protein